MSDSAKSGGGVAGRPTGPEVPGARSGPAKAPMTGAASRLARRPEPRNPAEPLGPFGAIFAFAEVLLVEAFGLKPAAGRDASSSPPRLPRPPSATTISAIQPRAAMRPTPCRPEMLAGRIVAHARPLAPGSFRPGAYRRPGCVRPGATATRWPILHSARRIG